MVSYSKKLKMLLICVWSICSALNIDIISSKLHKFLYGFSRIKYKMVNDVYKIMRKMM